MVLTDILFTSAEQYSNRIAFTMRMGYRTMTLTYEQVFTHAQAIARFLKHNYDIKQGDCIVICAPNSPWWICTWWGCVLAGARVVPVAPENHLDMINKIIAQTEAKVFFKGMSVRHAVSLPTETVEFIAHTAAPFQQPYKPGSPSQFPLIRPSDCVQIMYTSGTTGDPKGVILTHQNLTSNLQAIRPLLKLDGKNERLLSILPLSHMFELMGGFLVPFAEGAHVVYAHSHGALKQLLKKYRITTMISVPEFLKVMAAKMQASFSDTHLLWLFKGMLALARVLHYKPLQWCLFYPLHRSLGGKLKTVASGGAPLDPELERLWNRLGVWVLQGYGLTETAPTLSINTWDDYRFGSVGKPLRNVHVKIDSDGELLVQGPNVFVGYFKNPEKTAAAFTPDGFFKTGDMGEIDADGFIFLKGRKKYMILGPGGQNIFPEDIESALNHHPAVADSCVLGLEAAGGRVTIHAVLLLKNDRTQPEAIIDFANSKLASYQQISAWSIWEQEDFPRSITRKVKRDLVQKMLQSNAEQQGAVEPKGDASPLYRLVAHIANVEPETIHRNMGLVHDLMFDSLMNVELITSVEERFGKSIDETKLTAKTTVGELEQLLSVVQPKQRLPHVARWPRWLPFRALRLGLQLLLRGVLRLMVNVKVVGLEHLKAVNGPLLFMPNHVSLFDGMVVCAALPRLTAEKNSFAAGFDVLYEEYRWAAKIVELAFNAFPFPRKESDPVSVGFSNMGELLDAGYHVTVFPEGHVSPDGTLQPLKKGAGVIAVAMGVPVIPVKIIGLEKLVPYNSIVPRQRGTVVVKLGAPMVFTPLQTQEEIMSALEKALRDL